MNKHNMRAFIAWNTLTKALINFSVSRNKRQKLFIASHGEEFEVTIKRLPKKGYSGHEIAGFVMDDSFDWGQDNEEKVPGNERLEE